MLRRFFVGGNWKSNGTVQSSRALAEQIAQQVQAVDDRVDLVVAPIDLHIGLVKDIVPAKVKVAAQNVSGTGMGAYTGETSAAAVKDFGLEWVIVGHSERRTLYHECDKTVAAKVEISLKAGLNVIACIGETLEARKAGNTFDVIKRHLDGVAAGVKDQKQWAKIVIAYEPVWSIGTGVTASPEQAEEVHVYIRNYLADNVSKSVSNETRIIYGGSVKPDNSVNLIQQKNIDGFLVGGASLDAKSFIQIANAPKLAGRFSML
ncbi:unnamed protein product (mitochondrion) [Plasmodiophora brassicae]|uniref:Triosephosphate isomerase n=1 Tax=Plasmodiophora brassicae TaxID=37360 RepID=A0A3P3Y446_PLABS|nr:unnamed protein product [Plasmodiophora brassicae]